MTQFAPLSIPVDFRSLKELSELFGKLPAQAQRVEAAIERSARTAAQRELQDLKAAAAAGKLAEQNERVAAAAATRAAAEARATAASAQAASVQARAATASNASAISNERLAQASARTAIAQSNQQRAATASTTASVRLGTAYLGTAIASERLEQATLRTEAAKRRLAEQSTRSSDALGTLGNVYGLAARAAALFGVAISVRGLAAYALSVARAGDEIRTLSTRLNVLGGAADGSRDAFDRVFKVAQGAGVELGDVGQVFAGLTLAARDFGATSTDIERVTSTLLKLGRIGGSTQGELVAGALQLRQALASGRLNGDELRSVLENMPLVARAIAKEFGVSVGELRKLGAEGRLVSDRVFKALVNAGQDVDAQFKKLPVTLEQAGTRAGNAWKLFAAALDDATGISKFLSTALDRTADHVTTLAKRMRGDIGQQIIDLRTEASRLQAQVDAARARPVPAGVRGTSPSFFGSGRVRSFEEQTASREDYLAAQASRAAGELERFQAEEDYLTRIREGASAAEHEADAIVKKFREIQEIIHPVNKEFVTLVGHLEDVTRLLAKGKIDADDFARATSGLGGKIAAYQNQSDPTIQSDRERMDAEEIARVSRRERQIAQARITANREADHLIEQGKLAVADREKYVADKIGKTYAELTTQARDAAEDLKDQLTSLDAQFAAVTKGAYAMREAAAQAEAIAQSKRPGGVDPDEYVKRFYRQESVKVGTEYTQIAREIEFQKELSGVIGDVNAEREIELRRKIELRQLDTDPQHAEAIDRQEREADAIRRANDLRRELIDLNKRFDTSFAFAKEIEHFEELRKQGQLTATAARGYLEDFYIKAGRAGEFWLDGATAGLLDFARQARNVGDQVASALVQAFSAGTDALAKLLLGMDVNIKTVINDIKLALARAAIGSAVTGPIAGLFGNLLGGLGLGGAGGGQAITVGGQQYVPISGGGGGILGSLFGGGGLGGGGLLGSLLGGGGLGSGGASFLGGIGAWLNQPLGISLSSGMGPVTADALGGLGSLTGMNVLGGLGGIASGIFGLASGNPIGGIAGILGGALSFIPGLGGLGTVVGLLGGLLGGLTKKKPKSPQAVSNLSFLDGAWSSSTAMSRGKGGSQLATGTNKAAGAVGDIIDELAGLYGLGLGEGTTGGFLINSVGKKTGNLWQVGLGTYANPQQLPAGFQNGGSTVTAAYTSPEEAISALAAMIVRQGATSGTLTGLTATQRTALRSEDITSIEAIKKALDFSKVYDRIVRGTENITQAEDAIEALNTQFRGLKVEAERYGLDVGIINQRMEEARRKVATDFNEMVRRGNLSISDPDALAREDLTKAQEARRKEADYLNTLFPGLINFADLIALNNAELTELEKTLGHANDNIRDALDRLHFSPEQSTRTIAQRYDMALSEYQGLEADVIAGRDYDKDRLTGVGDTLLAYARQRFSVTEDYANIADRYERLLKYILGDKAALTAGDPIVDIPAFADGGMAGPGMISVGERGREFLYLSQPARVVSSGDSDDIAGNTAEQTALLRSLVALCAEQAKELRGVRAEMADMKRQNKNDQSYRRTKGMTS